MLDPADAVEQFPGVYRFLKHKWYFDELYSALLVRPGLVVAQLVPLVRHHVIDGVLSHGLATVHGAGVALGRPVRSRIVDGLVNLIGRRVATRVGNWLRGVQTGYLRSYVLFLVLAAIGICACC